MLKRLLLLTVAAALVLSAACGDGDDGGEATPVPGTPGQAAPTATETPVSMSTTGTVVVSAAAFAVGDTVGLTGANWHGEGAVQFYLLTPDQSADAGSAARAIANGEAPQVGEATPDAAGNMSFEFALEASYSTESGATLSVSSGQELTTFARQGSGGSRADPFTVQ